MPQNADWESPCPTIIAGSDPENIPTALLIELLLDNATNARGSWCLEQAGGKAVVTFMHRFPAELLTAEEFVKICSTTVTVVESFECALREKVQEAWMNHAGQCGRLSDQAP